MSCGSILSTDQIFRKLSDITLETKRRLLGKYVTGDKYETDFTQSIYHRDGVPICSNKFNFSIVSLSKNVKILMYFSASTSDVFNQYW